MMKNYATKLRWITLAVAVALAAATVPTRTKKSSARDREGKISKKIIVHMTTIIYNEHFFTDAFGKMMKKSLH